MIAMKTWKHDFALRLMKLFNVVLISVPFALCWYGYYAGRVAVPFYNKGNWLIVALFVILYVIFARVYEAFLVSLNRISEMVYSQGLAVLISDGIMFLILWLLVRRFPNFLPALGALCVQIVRLLCGRRWPIVSEQKERETAENGGFPNSFGPSDRT